MKKILLSLSIITFFIVSCNNNNLSDSHWLAVKSYPIPPGTGNSIYDGMTIHFTNDKLFFGDVYNEKRNNNYDLRIINSKKIFLNDTLWAVSLAEYQDSLILDIKESVTRVKFVRLSKEYSRENKPEIWKHKNWILSYNDYRRELFLTDSLFFYESDSKLCIQKDLQVNQFVNTIDKWKSVSINGNQLFIKTFHQADNEFYRIKGYVGDSIIQLQSLQFANVKTDLRKRRYISESKRQEITNKIQNEVWKTDEILSLDTLGQGSRDWDSYLIKFESLKDKKVSFKFSSDSTYHIYESDSQVISGNWKVSKTGNEIILNNGISPSDYIDLITFNSDSLVIGNLRRFEPKEENYGMDVKMYYKIKLTK